MGDAIPEPLSPKTDLEAREVYCACLLHGVHKAPLVELPSYLIVFGRRVRVGTLIQPVSAICGPGCGAVFVTYPKGLGPECHCLDS